MYIIDFNQIQNILKLLSWHIISETEATDLLNQYRESLGLPPLKYDFSLLPLMKYD
jgi:uncharacterized protein YkwD